MAVRRINSTGRKKILREDAQFAIHRNGDGGLFWTATLDLAEYDLPDDALVFVEAYRQTNFMRFPVGMVAQRTDPPQEARWLSEFATPDGLLFRVKVTSSGERPGMLLAEADQIAPRDDDEQPDHRIPLLPTVQASLGQKVWAVDFDGAVPQLLLNDKVADWKALVATPTFRALVFPAAMREVLMRAVFVSKVTDSEDDGSWESRWIRFAASLPGVDEHPPDADAPEDWHDWIERAVEEFARLNRLHDQFAAALGESP